MRCAGVFYPVYREEEEEEESALINRANSISVLQGRPVVRCHMTGGFIDYARLRVSNFSGTQNFSLFSARVNYIGLHCVFDFVINRCNPTLFLENCHPRDKIALQRLLL